MGRVWNNRGEGDKIESTFVPHIQFFKYYAGKIKHGYEPRLPESHDWIWAECSDKGSIPSSRLGDLVLVSLFLFLFLLFLFPFFLYHKSQNEKM